MLLQIIMFEYALDRILNGSNHLSLILSDKRNADKVCKLWKVFVFLHF